MKTATKNKMEKMPKPRILCAVCEKGFSYDEGHYSALMNSNHLLHKDCIKEEHNLIREKRTNKLLNLLNTYKHRLDGTEVSLSSPIKQMTIKELQKLNLVD